MGHTNHYLAIEGEAKDWEEAIRLCGQAIADAGYADETFMNACIEREKEYPTGLPSEVPVAIPHSKVEGIKDNCVCFLRLKNPVTFYRMDSDEDVYKRQGWIEEVGNQSYKCKFEAWKVATMLDRTDADMEGIEHTAATACEPPILCATGTGSLYIAKKDQRGPQEESFKDLKHRA